MVDEHQLGVFTVSEESVCVCVRAVEKPTRPSTHRAMVGSEGTAPVSLASGRAGPSRTQRACPCKRAGKEREEKEGGLHPAPTSHPLPRLSLSHTQNLLALALVALLFVYHVIVAPALPE